MYNVLQFSGGKDSTAMLLMALEKGIKIDEIIFCDTGKEFPTMYEHIEKVEKYIGRKVTRLKAAQPFDYYMFDHIKTKGKNKGQRGYSWPTMRIRWCTTILKQQPTERYLKGIGEYISFIGIAYDEPKRHQIEKRPNVRHLLYEWQVTEAQALQYCYKHGFDWGGLYEDFKRLSCWCCPLKNEEELRILYNKYPALWAKLKEMDSKTYNQFKDKGVNFYEKKFELEKQQQNIFLTI